MKAVAFDVKGSLAHFRKPDTTATQLTYPFITPTAAKGLVGAILGIEDFVTTDKIGIQLLRPVLTVAQQLSMLGKDGGQTFNRPTTMELLIQPAYRIFYAGSEHVEELIRFLREGHSTYPTFLGVAFALTKPILHKIYDKVELVTANSLPVIETEAVVPTSLIKELHFQTERYYSRAGGFLRYYKGQRTFEKSIDFLYEREGKSIAFIPAMDRLESEDFQIAEFGGNRVCLF